MSTLPAVRERDALALSTDTDRLSDAVRETLRNADAKNTQRSYEWLWRNFTGWCEAAGRDTLPATADTVVLFLQALKDRGYARSTIRMHVSAVSQAHRRSGHDSPTGADVVRRFLRGVARELPNAPNRKDALLAEHILAMLPEGDSPAALRDRALLLTGIAGGFRRSELAALDRSHLIWTSKGLVVRVPRSKTDAAGLGASVGLLYARREPRLCAPTALRAWIDHLNLTDDPQAPMPCVFRPINKAGRVRSRRITPESINRIVQDRAATAGLGVDLDVGAHSLRAGMVTELASRGAKLEDVAKHGRWQSLAMVLRYYRPATVLDTSPSGLF